MKNQKVDLRVQKTKKSIREAFIHLLKTKTFERISVKDISDEAMINRNTFYLHYVDKFDLLDQLLEENFNKFYSFPMPDKVDHESITIDTFRILLQNIFNVVEENMDFYKAMLNHNNQISFSSQLKDAFANVSLSKDCINKEDPTHRIALEHMLSGLVGVIYLWIEEYENIKKDDVINKLSEIFLQSSFKI